jgi:peptidyl-prolyl isomerase E (cyclophilin E)
VEFDLEEDAEASIDNMDNSEIMGKVIRCNLAKAMPKLTTGQAVWNSSEWTQNNPGDMAQSEDRGDEKELTLVPTRFEEEEDDDIIQ